MHTNTERQEHDMKYKYSQTAGYYGRGGWVCYTESSRGAEVWKVFGSEAEAAAYCERYSTAR